MRKLLIHVIFLLSAHVVMGQQQPLYTQFMYNKQGLNPAYAGNDDVVNVGLIYRNQWLGFDGAPVSQQLSFSAPVWDQRVGIGVNLSNVSIGVTKMITAEMQYAYKINLGYGTLSGGIQGSWRSLAVDYSDPRLVASQGTLNDPAFGNDNFRRDVLNVGAGIYFTSDYFYCGISAPRIMNVNIDFDEILDEGREVQHVYFMTGGTIYSGNEDWEFTPQVLVRYADNTPLDVDVNFSTTYLNRYTAGLTYRLGGDSESIGESIDVILAMQATPSILFGLAYDYTLSEIRNHSSGSIELVANFRFGTSSRSQEFINPRYF